jgi:hypothetical protein
MLRYFISTVVLCCVCAMVVRGDEYSLTVKLTEENVVDLKNIGHSICFAKKTIGFDLGAVWRKLAPKEIVKGTDTIKWKEEFELFYSQEVYDNGFMVKDFESNSSITLSSEYNFDTEFKLQKTKAPIGTVIVNNKHDGQYTIGLSQLIDGKMQTIGAMPTNKGLQMSLTPKLYIFVFVCRHEEGHLFKIEDRSADFVVEYEDTEEHSITINTKEMTFALAE